jgi:flagellar hook-length control protein FliK
VSRLNTDNLAAFLSVETPAADSPTPRAEPEAKPFDAFLQRAGRSPDTGAEDAARASESGPRPSKASDPIDAQSDSTEQDITKPTESEPEENPGMPDSDQPEATDTQSDDETDQQVDAASGARSDGNTDGKEQAAVGIDLTEIALTGGGQETGDDSATDEDQSRGSRAGTKDRQSGSGTAQAAEHTATSGRSEQAPVEPEASTEEEKPTDLRRQSEERKPVGRSEGTPEPSAGGDEAVTESKAAEENASSQSRIDNPFDPTVSPQGRQARSEKSRQRTGRQGSTGAVDRSSRAVAKTLAGQGMATSGEQVNADEIGAAAEEITQEKTVKTASTADLKATSATSPKGWSPEGLRSTTAPSTADGTQTDQVDRVRFVQRVARAFEALGDGNGSMRLRLKPPELGGLRLEVSIRNGVMTAHIETETSAARTLLLDNLPALRERLAQQDIRVESFDVDLADRSPDGSPQRPDDDRQPRDQPDGQESQAPENQDGDTVDGGLVGAVTRAGEGARLDVVI